METKNILLDMDGVLTNFIQGAIDVLNEKLGKTVTIDQYVEEFASWEITDYYDVSVSDFWSAIESKEDFWLNLKILPYAKQLYEWLSSEYEVTIVTTPSMNPDCARQKLEWLKRHLGITPDKVFIGGRKYLMAGNGILIDDWRENTKKFTECGGKAILVSSNWNTLWLHFEFIKKQIQNEL